MLRWLSKPVTEQLPFFAATFALLVPGTAKYAFFYHDAFPDEEYFHFFSLAFLVSYVLTATVHVARNRWVKGCAYAFTLSLFVLHMYLWIAFKRLMSPLLAIVVGETNLREASEFCSAYLFNRNGAIVLAILLATLATVIIFERFRRSLAHWLSHGRRPLAVGFMVLATLVCGLLSTEVYVSLFQCQTSEDLEKWGHAGNDVQPMDNFSALLYASFGPQTAREELRRAVLATSDACHKDTPTHADDTLTVVFVIGESHIKQHSHLYGYPLDTSPCLDREQAAGNLFAFDDIVSPYNLTTMAVKNLLCTNSIGDGEHWYDTPFLPAIFKQAGFRVYMWDNQRSMSEDEVFTFALNSFLYNPDIQALSYDATNKECYPFDGQLTDDFFRTIPHQDKSQLWLFHFMGQHFTPEDRYPRNARFEHFTADSIKSNLKGITRQQRTEIAYYDNATRYIDHLLGDIISRISQQNAILVYLSDHGEEMYDYRLSRGRTSEAYITRQMAAYQNGIPFIVWCSDTYQERHPDIMADLRASLHRPAMSDNTCQLLFRLAQVHTRYYRPERDISSPAFKQRRRIIYDNIDFDHIP